MKIVVTGGAGFIGCNLADRLLQEDRDVVVLDNLARPGTRLNVDWLRERHDDRRLAILEGDIRDADFVTAGLAGAEAVFHLAGQTAVTTAIADPRTDLDVNIVGTLNVLEAARACEPAPVVVFSSTNKVYGDLEDQRVVEEPTRYTLPELPHGVPETVPLGFTSPYACSKGAADQYVLAYAATYGVPAVVFRQSCIYGPRQMGMEEQGWVAWFVLRSVLGLGATIYGDGKQVRDLLYIDDLVDAYLAVLDSVPKASGRAYNIGGGPAFAVSIWHEFGQLLERLGYAVPSVQFEPPRLGDQRVYVSDNRRATAELGWAPRTAPEDGVRRLAEWVESAASTLQPLYA